MQANDTICAISTPQGVGGIAVLRVSGPDAITIVGKLFCPKNPDRQWQTETGSRLVFGTINNTQFTIHNSQLSPHSDEGQNLTPHSDEGQNLTPHSDEGQNLKRNKILKQVQDEVIDEVMLSVFRAPHSFTGEDTVEISCHGSLYIQQTILQLLVGQGCRLARGGEFTQRAFLNGKLDLSEAEAVADIIAAENKAAHDLALNHLRGGISTELRSLRDKLLNFTSLIELELDFADHEELEFADRTELVELANVISNKINSLLESFKTGNAIKNGIQVAIIGPTNAGKSTLLNALVGEERAIVSDIHGTTRDTIEDTAVIGGILFRFIDTAGLRQTDNKIEAIGIERSRETAKKADVVLLVKDISEYSENSELSEFSEFSEFSEKSDNSENSDKKVIIVYNKSDLATSYHPSVLENSVLISAKNGKIQPLTDKLLMMFANINEQQKTLISNARHYEALKNAKSAIDRVKEGLSIGLSGELLAMDLHDCLDSLGEITGQITSQEVLNNIFSKFCIGK
ncbi:MAG: tRNA uridine-5-carboxymethylaminomethyl(34) synthesis GTPase MnmE [Paludibacteraceae bacterium]|nr:tRNA uridine-5-carboxymethylaminomethyl(34) synthesis GTPase MnmE [Paludibacteraceae bacterium]